MNPHIFRAYDIRGIAEEDLTDYVVEQIGKAYGTKVSRIMGHGAIGIGRDVRLTSERIQNALTRGILSTGMDVVHLGMVTTPMTYYSHFLLGTAGTVMVTGSHNPIEFNGLKLNCGPESIHGDGILDLLRMIESGDFETGKGKQSQKNMVTEYKKMLGERIHLRRPFKIVVDAGNGTAGPIAPDVLRSLGCTVVCLYCDPDGRFPNHLPDPTVLKYTEALRKRVLSEKADLGLGYDGDADRVGIIDGTGRVVFADQVLALLSRDVLKRNPGKTIIFDVKCSRLLPEEIAKAGGRPLMWKTGHSLIKSKMKEENAPLAGEMSGHIFFKDGYFGFDDGIYVSLRLVQVLSMQEKSLADLVDSLPKYVSTPEIRISCPDEQKFDVVRRLTEDFRKQHEVIDVDGARVNFKDGWGLVRVSNTQPILVLRFEAGNAKQLAEIQNLFRQKLSEYPGIGMDEWEA